MVFQRIWGRHIWLSPRVSNKFQGRSIGGLVQSTACLPRVTCLPVMLSRAHVFLHIYIYSTIIYIYIQCLATSDLGETQENCSARLRRYLCYQKGPNSLTCHTLPEFFSDSFARHTDKDFLASRRKKRRTPEGSKKANLYNIYIYI